MSWSKVVDIGKKVVETGVEKALVAANALEQVGRMAAEGYNHLADKAPFPLPHVPFGSSPQDEATSPASEPVHVPETPKAPEPVVSTESILETKPVAPAPKAAEPVAKKEPKEVAAPSKPKAPKAAKKAKKAPAAKKAAEAKTAEPAEAEAKPVDKPKRRRRRAIPSFNTLMKKYRKADLHELCEELNLPHEASDSQKDLAQRISDKGEAMKAAAE